MTVYNKLVRDKIPQFIESQGEVARVRILSDEEYLQHLETKLDEEVREFHADQNLEELADILEVVISLAKAKGYSPAQLEDAYRRKHDQRGGFDGKFFLISKD